VTEYLPPGYQHPDLSRPPVIMPQHPAQPGIALDFAGIKRHLGWGWRKRNRFVPESLMWAHGVVVALIFPEQVFQMALSKNDELADTFILDRLYKPFRERVQVGRPVGQFLHLDPFAFENLIEFLRKLGVTVFDQIGSSLASFGQLHHQVPCLLFHPRAVRLASWGTNTNPSRANMDEEEDVVSDFPEPGPDILRKKIACP